MYVGWESVLIDLRTPEAKYTTCNLPAVNCGGCMKPCMRRHPVGTVPLKVDHRVTVARRIHSGRLATAYAVCGKLGG